MSEDSESYSTNESDESSNSSVEYAQYIQDYDDDIETVCIVHDFFVLYDKIPRMTSNQTGDKWFGELFAGHSVRFHNMFRMTQQVFIDLLQTLVQSHGLAGSRRICAREVLAITLYILLQNESMRATCERFQHSTETICRYFFIGIKSLVRLSRTIIKPIYMQFRDVPSHIMRDERYMPYFKDCIGAIDGTHVDARVPVEDQVAYIGRHDTTTQNVMAVCDFNMCFTFIVAGWEGSAHDSRIFNRAIADRDGNFPHPPQGKYITEIVFN